MPLLKWGRKKSGRYELSQEIYVLTVYVGDTVLIQCTLSSESTGRECVEYIREKIGLIQSEIFGFRYQMRFSDPDRRQMRWADMEKPLRKQLEKFACKPRQIQLAILYHTSNVFALHDQVARNLYFMLLKLDVLAGKFNIELEKYVNLAAYGLQVENSDYDPMIHTMDYLRTLQLLPEHLCRNNAQLLDDLLQRIVTVYERLSGMQSSYAAFLYIVDVQQCDGYAEEHFPAKDDESTDVRLGYSLEDVFVKRYNGHTLRYRWQDVRAISAAKRQLIVKYADSGASGLVAVASSAVAGTSTSAPVAVAAPPTTNTSATTASVAFTLEDVEMAKYVCMVLNWQWNFATTDAIQQKLMPMSINNLQSGFRKLGSQCGYLRHSNADIHSTRTTNSIDMGVMSSNGGGGGGGSNVVGGTRPMSAVAVNRSASMLASTANRCNTASTFNVNMVSGGNYSAINQSTVHSLTSAVMTAACSPSSAATTPTSNVMMPLSLMAINNASNGGVGNKNCAIKGSAHFFLPPSISTPSLAMMQNDVHANSPTGGGMPSPAYCQRGSNTVVAENAAMAGGRPPAFSLSQTPPSVGQQRRTTSVAGRFDENGVGDTEESGGVMDATNVHPSSSSDAQNGGGTDNASEDWWRFEQREILKKLLAEQKMIKTIGSSPEIHMLGVNTPNLRNNGMNGGGNNNRVNGVYAPSSVPYLQQLYGNNNNWPSTSTGTFDQQYCANQQQTHFQQHDYNKNAVDYGNNNNNNNNHIGHNYGEATTTNSNVESFRQKWCSTPNLMIATTTTANGKVQQQQRSPYLTHSNNTNNNNGIGSGNGRRRYIGARQHRHDVSSGVMGTTANSSLSNHNGISGLYGNGIGKVSSFNYGGSSGALVNEVNDTKNGTPPPAMPTFPAPPSYSSGSFSSTAHSTLVGNGGQPCVNPSLALLQQQQQQLFSQGHVVASSAGSATAIGQPIVYPIPSYSLPSSAYYMMDVTEPPITRLCNGTYDNDNFPLLQAMTSGSGLLYGDCAKFVCNDANVPPFYYSNQQQLNNHQQQPSQGNSGNNAGRCGNGIPTNEVASTNGGGGSASSARQLNSAGGSLVSSVEEEEDGESPPPPTSANDDFSSGSGPVALASTAVNALPSMSSAASSISSSMSSSRANYTQPSGGRDSSELLQYTNNNKSNISTEVGSVITTTATPVATTTLTTAQLVPPTKRHFQTNSQQKRGGKADGGDTATVSRQRMLNGGAGGMLAPKSRSEFFVSASELGGSGFADGVGVAAAPALPPPTSTASSSTSSNGARICGFGLDAKVSVSTTTATSASDGALLSVLLAKLAIPQAIETEFAGIPAKRLSAGYSTSQCPENQAKNRECKVFPYEDTRVKLHPHKRNSDGYINASNVLVPIGDDQQPSSSSPSSSVQQSPNPSVNHRRLSVSSSPASTAAAGAGGRRRGLRYIVAQAPMRNTIDDFWSMIWESGARLIIMLVNPHQTHKADAIPTYWPLKAKEKMNVGGYFLKLVSRNSTSKCQTTSVLTLKSMSRGERRTIYHLYCADFNEDGVPSSTDAFLGFIDAVRSVKRHIVNETRQFESFRRKNYQMVVQHQLMQKAADDDNGKKSRSRSIARPNLIGADPLARTGRAKSVEGDGAAASTSGGTSSSWIKKFSLAGSASSPSAPTAVGVDHATAEFNGGTVGHLPLSFSSTASRRKPLLSLGDVDATMTVDSDGEFLPLTVVHCTDGASESGIYVLVEVLMRCIECNVEVDIAQVLRSLRQQRMCLVKRPGQYRFVYELVVAFLQQSRLI